MTSVFIFLSGFDPGTYFIEDDGIPNNGIVQLRGPDGSIIPFSIPTEFLTVTASPGRSVIFNLGESFGAADINVGSLTNSADNPDNIEIRLIAGAGDVSLVANGFIGERGNDAAADIIATTLILSAAAGVGTPGNALETQVGTLEAETATGGINLTNYGNVVVGGLTDDVVGLDVDTSGDLLLTNFGTIVLSEQSPGGFESVHGGTSSGNVTLIANGFDADIVSNVDQDAIAAAGGSIILTAGRDVSMGTLGLNFDNDVRARGDLIITTGRDLNIDGFADFASDGFGAATGGDVIVNAGRDINLLNSTGTDASLGAEGSGGGNTILNTGPGGFTRLLAGSTATLFSSTGDIFVNTDRMIINASSGITASSGDVTITTRTAGWNVDLGSVTDGAFALELSDAELDRIFTSSLTIGGTNAGNLNVSSGISPAGATNVVLRSGANLQVSASVTVAGTLDLFAGKNIFQLPASVVTATTFNAFVDRAPDGTGGIGTLNGTITAGLRTLNGNLDDDELNGSSGADLIFGGGGDDIINGFAGNDDLRGQSGNDDMSGGLGLDTIFGGPGADTIDGNEDNDVLSGGADNDAMSGGDGNDIVQGADGDDTMDGDAGDDELRGQDGVDTLRGGIGNDDLFGGPGIDTLQGGADNDELFGGGENDILQGEAGADQLTGGLGADALTGGADLDTFFFREVADSTPAQTDTILDFVLGELIDLTVIDANSAAGGDQAFAFIGAAAFGGVAGQLRAVQVSPGLWNVQGDVNGDAVADVQLQVLVADVHALGAGDFVL